MTDEQKKEAIALVEKNIDKHFSQIKVLFNELEKLTGGVSEVDRGPFGIVISGLCDEKGVKCKTYAMGNPVDLISSCQRFQDEILKNDKDKLLHNMILRMRSLNKDDK